MRLQVPKKCRKPSRIIQNVVPPENYGKIFKMGHTVEFLKPIVQEGFVDKTSNEKKKKSILFVVLSKVMI